jgi:hypothetical protein
MFGGKMKHYATMKVSNRTMKSVWNVKFARLNISNTNKIVVAESLVYFIQKSGFIKKNGQFQRLMA